ncbi:MAG: hypothetical protein F4X79_10415 [Acidobacteria bacterium]|nr:hypothetical protein [Acidobacteriota bacterium]
MHIGHRPHLDTVVILKAFDANDEFCGAGTGFFCYARHSHRRTRKLLFLVTNAHVVGRVRRRFDVLFRPPGAEEAFVYSVTAKSGAGPGTWFTAEYCDIAALLLDATQIPDEIQVRAFDVETDTLSIRELRQAGIAEGAEGRLVGFVEAARGTRLEYPAYRSVTLAQIPRRWGLITPLFVEGTAFPGNSGSPVILKPEPGFGQRPNTDPDGKLIGITRAVGSTWSMGLLDGDRAPIEVDENATIVHLVPVDDLRALLHRAVGRTILAETFGAMVQKVRSWLPQRKTAD